MKATGLSPTRNGIYNACLDVSETDLLKTRSRAMNVSMSSWTTAEKQRR
jgi:hypothetical protein